MPTHETLADAFLNMAAAEWIRFSAAVSACHWSILPTLLDKTPRRDIRNRRRLRYHVMVTVRCDLFIESLSVGASAHVHTNNWSSMGSQNLLNPSRPWWPNFHNQFLHHLMCLHPKIWVPCTTNQATQDHGFPTLPLTKHSHHLYWSWPPLSGSRTINSSNSKLFLRAVQTSFLRPNRGSQHKNTDKRGRNTACRTRKDAQNLVVLFCKKSHQPIRFARSSTLTPC